MTWFWLFLTIAIISVAVNSARGKSGSRPAPIKRGDVITLAKESEPDEASPFMAEVMSAVSGGQIQIDWPATFHQIERAVAEGDYDFARMWLQKFAYTTVEPDVAQHVRDQFKALMTAFAKGDPLYQIILGRVRPLVVAEPGILQTKLYPHVPEYDAEQVRYALYFAHELGDVVRIKKGRSYAVFPPGHEAT